MLAMLESIVPKDPGLRAMGYEQRMVLLDQVMEAVTQHLATQFGMDAESMALTLSNIRNYWVIRAWP